MTPEGNTRNAAEGARQVKQVGGGKGRAGSTHQSTQQKEKLNSRLNMVLITTLAFLCFQG